MNERIKELAAQAKLKTELWNNPEPFLIYKEDPSNPGGLEKFAELIVRECMQQADNEASRFYNMNEDDCAFAMENYCELIKQHFGVGE